MGALAGLILNPLSRIIAISAIAFIAGVYTGSTLAVKHYKAKELAALNAQIAHNEKVIVWSRKEITRLIDQEEKLEALVEKLNDEADKAPDSNIRCLSADGVRRLNQTR